MKTTLVKFPVEPVATLKFGNHEIEMSHTFIHALAHATASFKQDTGFYSRDLAEFHKAVEAMNGAMREDMGREYTDEERSLLLERSQAKGVGYWSSWMDEPDPFEPQG